MTTRLIANKGSLMQTKKQLLRAIRKETKAPKGFTQWVLILEHRRLSDVVGLLRFEAQLDGKDEWSGSISVNLPEQKKYTSDGREVPNEWDKITPGQSRFNVFTFEVRGKSVLEATKAFFKRSFEDGKLQDWIPFVKG
jgi:hypothetical protein